MNPKTKKAAVSIYEWLDALVFALVAVTILFVFIFKIYTVSGRSMEPTLYNDNRLFAWCLGYSPKQGDVVILDEELVLGDSIVKRVAATENQVVAINPKTGEITVDGVPFDAPVATTQNNLYGNVSFPLIVPEGYIFVLGDNRAVSNDSRYEMIGFVDERSVIGKVEYVFASGNMNGKVE